MIFSEGDRNCLVFLSDIAELRKKFEEDKQRISLLRAQRKFRPYWIHIPISFTYLYLPAFVFDNFTAFVYFSYIINYSDLPILIFIILKSPAPQKRWMKWKYKHKKWSAYLQKVLFRLFTVNLCITSLLCLWFLTLLDAWPYSKHHDQKQCSTNSSQNIHRHLKHWGRETLD